MSVTISKNVSDCMTRNVISVKCDEQLTRAMGLMNCHELSALPVVDSDGRVCGVLSISDLIGAVYDLRCELAVLPVVSECVRKSLTDAIVEDNQDVKVSEVMTSDIKTIGIDASIENAATRLITSAVHRLLVIDTDNRPIGIVSTFDIVRAVAEATGGDGKIQDTTRWKDDGGKSMVNNYYGSTIDDEDVDANL